MASTDAVPDDALPATQAGEFELRGLRTHAEFDACVELQRMVWGESFGDVVPTGVLRVVQYVGGVVAGAFTGAGDLAGFVFGVSGIRRQRPSHWSDTLAVHPEFRNRGLGERLKRYQRDLLLPLGVERVYWTFDPLESKNGYLNFARLGAVAGRYRRDFYGATHSRLHAVIGTDRLIAVWRIRSKRVVQRLRGSGRAVARDLAAVPLLNPTVDSAGGPVSRPVDLDVDAPRVRLAVPADIQHMKDRSPALAAEWRRITRTAFESYFARRYVACDVVRGEPCSSYLLERVRER